MLVFVEQLFVGNGESTKWNTGETVYYVCSCMFIMKNYYLRNHELSFIISKYKRIKTKEFWDIPISRDKRTRNFCQVDIGFPNFESSEPMNEEQDDMKELYHN